MGKELLSMWGKLNNCSLDINIEKQTDDTHT